MTDTGAVPRSDRERSAFLDALTHDDPIALYDAAPCGFLTTTPDGVVVKANATFRAFVGRGAESIVGTTLNEHLTAGSRIYWGTHVGPSLLMSDQVREIALDLVRTDGSRVPVLVNASLARGEDGEPRAVRLAVFDATERRRYEHQLLLAKDRADDARREAEVLARALQQTLIPPLPPEVPGLDLAAAYHPAGHGTQVGGDFYDVFSVADGDWVVTLGDVCGKGYEAAIVTALVRHTIRALCVGEERPHAVLAGLDEVLQHHPTDRFCTAVLLRLHREGDGWRVTIALGGHPQPLLVRSGVPSAWVGEHGPLIGVVTRPVHRDTVLHLDPGDTLLLFTDGVTEGRRGDELYGEDRLVALVDRVGPVPSALVDETVRAVADFQSGTLRDDVAVVALGVPRPQ